MDFYSILKDLNPAIIHIHHYVHIGLDLLHALKRWFQMQNYLDLHIGAFVPMRGVYSSVMETL